MIPALLLEIAFRVLGPVVPGDYQTTRLVAASEAFGRQNMANRSGWKRSDEYSVHVRVNSQGLRGDETPYAKPPGMFRVLVVGDSFTFAAQVDEERTLVEQLGHELRARLVSQDGTPPTIQTINAGVDGWTTANELAWIGSEGLRYQPDLVVLMFYTGNDPGENFDLMKAVRRVGVDLEPDVALPARDARRWLADRSTLYAFIETGVLSRLLPAPDPDELSELSATTELRIRRSADDDRQERGWQLSGDLLTQLRVLLDEHKVGLLVVGIPTVEHVVNADRPPTPFLDIAARAAVPAIDLLQPFRSTPEDVKGKLYFAKDRHWTETGHALAARHVAEELLRRDLVRVEAANP